MPVFDDSRHSLCIDAKLLDDRFHPAQHSTHRIAEWTNLLALRALLRYRLKREYFGLYDILFSGEPG